MGDFGQVGTANLWKSAPFFSTGTNNAELKVTGLRLNLRSRLRRCRDGFVGEMAGKGWNEVGPKLSTAFAEPSGLSSPGKVGSTHRAGGS
jgi:hypothetical protein